jgi:hypothetical protein
MSRFILLLAAILYLAACADHGKVVDSNENEIKLKIGYNAAINNVTTKPAADEHCEDKGKKAVWIGHDRDGNMHYKCI